MICQRHCSVGSTFKTCSTSKTCCRINDRWGLAIEVGARHPLESLPLNWLKEKGFSRCLRCRYLSHRPRGSEAARRNLSRMGFSHFFGSSSPVLWSAWWSPHRSKCQSCSPANVRGGCECQQRSNWVHRRLGWDCRSCPPRSVFDNGWCFRCFEAWLCKVSRWVGSVSRRPFRSVAWSWILGSGSQR